MTSNSLLSRSWTYAWKNNRREVLRAFLGLLRDRPVFLFLTVACIAHPTWWSLLVVPLAFLFNQMIIEIFAKRVALHAQLNLQTSLLNSCESPDIESRSATRYKISDYLGWQYEDINKNLLKRFLGLLGIDAFSIDDTVDLYHIQIAGATCPTLICYSVPPLKSYIFLNAAPHEKNQVSTKFFLLHELGHAALHFAATSTFAQHSTGLYLTLMVFLAVSCTHPASTVFYCVIGALLSMSLAEKLIVGRAKKVNDECIADNLAIGYLTIEERKMLREIFIRYPPKDAALSDLQNKLRHQALMDNLELMISGKEEKEDIALDKVASRVFKPGFGLLIITCALVSTLAFYSVKIGGYFTLGLFVACIASVLVFCVQHLMIYALNTHITDRLAKWTDQAKLPQFSTEPSERQG